MKIGDEDCQFDVEYTQEQVKDIEFDWPPRFANSKYYDINAQAMLPDAPEELKKEFAAFAWAIVEGRKKGVFF